MDPSLGVKGGDPWCRMVYCISRKCSQLERSLGVDLDERVDQPIAGRQSSKLESLVRGGREEE